jgi:hypothetical protein
MKMILFFLVYSQTIQLACGQENSDFQSFWKDFKYSVSKNKEALSEKINFPLENAQTLIGRNDNGLTLEEYQLHYDKVFTKYILEQINRTDFKDLKTYNNKQDWSKKVKGKIYWLEINEKYFDDFGEGTITIAFFFWKSNDGKFYLNHIETAG